MTQSARGTVVFAPLAMNQTLFFHALGEVLRADGYRVAYICFHQRSHELLVAKGAFSLDAFAEGRAVESFAEYAIDNLNLLFNHERAAYEAFDTPALVAKLACHLGAMRAIFDRIEREAPGPVWLVQELGGFLSVLAAFYEARRRGISNVFIEPSFFRGRVFFVRDSFAALPVAGPGGKPAGAALTAYLERALQEQTVVIPLKDRPHYRAPVEKLLDRRNLRRLMEKSLDRYVRGKHEEFEHIGGHVARHVRMYLNNRRLRRHYRKLPAGAPFIYYPLHVPADFALTIRSPEYLDQLALLDFLTVAVPYPCRVAVKEHPALVGAVHAPRMKALLESRDNLVLLNPRINNYEVMRRAAAVVTVNSKSGAEALLLGKPVLVLGDAFYRPCSLVRAVDRLGDLPGALAKVLAQPPQIARGSVESYFQGVWDRSLPGELYDVRPDNIATFHDSLIKVLHT